ncbi:peptidylprolyl isomerase fpr4 [Gonapodya sp. JEL0774]|nr:peptidylprolyl isomerase fpr4 [Gonapodya sp. JEL0774]
MNPKPKYALGRDPIPSFWGLKVVPGKSYSQTVEVPFRVTMAALGPSDNAGQSALFVTVDDNEFVLCTLDTAKPQQQTLDVQFAEGEQITFKATGPNPIYLTGSYMPEDEMDNFDSDGEDEDIADEADGIEGSDDGEDEDMEDADDGEDEDDEGVEAAIAAAIAGKKAAAKAKATKTDAKPQQAPPKAAPKAAAAAAAPATQPNKSTSAKRPLDSKEEVADVKKMKVEAGVKQAEPKQAEPKQPEGKTKQEKKKDGKPDAASKPDEKKEDAKNKVGIGVLVRVGGKHVLTVSVARQSPKAKTLPSGLVIEDVTVGEGARAKPGKTASVRYIGRLQSGKVFDSNTNGKPFKFVISKGEVIKGWDLGVQGMNVGGTRKLTVPPNLAYGPKGAPPEIPPNATLVFEVKLLEVS